MFIFSSLCFNLRLNPRVTHSWNSDSFQWLTPEVLERAKYPRLYGDFQDICFSFLSAGVLVPRSLTLTGFSPENPKHPHKSSPTWPGSHTQCHASVTDGAHTERGRERESAAKGGRCPDWLRRREPVRASQQLDCAAKIAQMKSSKFAPAVPFLLMRQNINIYLKNIMNIYKYNKYNIYIYIHTL